MARKKPQPPQVIQLKDSDKLTKYINDMLSVTDNSVKQAARHGVSETVNELMQNTINLLSSSGLQAMQPSRKYGVPLYMGVRGFMVKGEPTGVVHILGDTRHNDGTWRLRLHEHPSKLRKTKKGYSRGRLDGHYFFKHGARNVAEQTAFRNVEAAIDKTIQEINNE